MHWNILVQKLSRKKAALEHQGKSLLKQPPVLPAHMLNQRTGKSSHLLQRQAARLMDELK